MLSGRLGLKSSLGVVGMKRILLCLLSVVVFSGCGGGGGVGFLGDTFFDDGFAGDLIAQDDNYSTFQNQQLSVGDSNGVLANDFITFDDFDLNFPDTTASGGTIVGQDDGSFVYTPPQNFTGTDFFDYTLEDDFGVSTGNVVIAVNAPPPVGFFVDNLNGDDGSGSGASGAPFASIQAALTAAGANQTVTIRSGNGQVYQGAINMLDGQTLVGAGFEINPQGVVRPRLSGPVNMGNDCTLRGLRIEATGLAAVDGSTRTDGVVADCEITGATGFAIDLLSADGIWDIDGNLIENNNSGLDADISANEDLSILIIDNTFNNNTTNGLFLSAAGTSNLTAGILDNIFTNNQVGQSVAITSEGTASTCVDLNGNQNDDTYRLTRNTAIFQVEQFNSLGSLNTGTVTVTADAIQDVADGTCGFEN